MANMVKTVSYGAPQKQILLADELAFTIGAQIGNAGVTANEAGRKVVKAGTPLKGDLLDRDTAFVVASADANVVLLHDVDVTEGDVNGTIVVGGYIDLLKLDEDVQALVTDEVRTALNKITFLKGSRV